MLKRVEKIMTLILVLCILSLAAYNICINMGAVQIVSSSSAGSVHYTQSHYYKQEYEIKLSIVGDEKYILLVNGQPVQSEHSKEGYDVFKACEKDIISIDLRKCENEVSVFVADVFPFVSEPETGTKMFVQGGIKKLFELSGANE